MSDKNSLWFGISHLASEREGAHMWPPAWFILERETVTSLVIKPLFLVLVVQAPLTHLKHAPPVLFFHIRLVQTGSSYEVWGYTAQTQVQLQGPFRPQRNVSMNTRELKNTGMGTSPNTPTLYIYTAIHIQTENWPPTQERYATDM